MPALGISSQSPGTFSGSGFHFDEVGSIRLAARIADADYLGSGDVVGGDSAVVGRFTPSRIEVSPNGERLLRQRLWGQFSEPLDLADFPFDEHIFEIEIASVVHPEGLRLIPDPAAGRLLSEREEIHHYDQVLDHYETRQRDVEEQVQVGTETYVCGQRDLGALPETERAG